MLSLFGPKHRSAGVSKDTRASGLNDHSFLIQLEIPHQIFILSC